MRGRKAYGKKNFSHVSGPPIAVPLEEIKAMEVPAPYEGWINDNGVISSQGHSHTWTEPAGSIEKTEVETTTLLRFCKDLGHGERGMVGI